MILRTVARDTESVRTISLIAAPVRNTRVVSRRSYPRRPSPSALPGRSGPKGRTLTHNVRGGRCWTRKPPLKGSLLQAILHCLELRPLPSPGVTRLQRYYKPLRHPTVPSLSLTGVWLVIPDRALGLPVLRALSLCTCCRQYPGAAIGRRLRSSHPAVSAFPEIAVGSACTSSFSRLARRSLALRPAHSRRHLYVTCYTEGFSHFVSSMTAPVASGWSVHRVALSPTGKRRLLTAHAKNRTFRD